MRRNSIAEAREYGAESVVLARALALCHQAVGDPELPYAAQERLYSELDALLIENETLPDALLADAAFQALHVDLLMVRADYEFERERFLAEAIIDAGDTSPLEAFRSKESYDGAHAFEHAALAPYAPRRTLFVGSGPFPSTAMAFLRAHPGTSVACIERRADGCRMAAELARIFGCEDLEIILADALEITDFAAFDCVHVGTVVGVLPEEKSRVVAHFKRRVPPDALLALRTSVGPGRIIFPAVDLDDLSDVGYRLLPNPPQRTYSLILTDRKPVGS